MQINDEEHKKFRIALGSSAIMEEKPNVKASSHVVASLFIICFAFCDTKLFEIGWLLEHVTGTVN